MRAACVRPPGAFPRETAAAARDPSAGIHLAGEPSAMSDACADAPGLLPLFQKETIFSYRSIRFFIANRVVAGAASPGRRRRGRPPGFWTYSLRRGPRAQAQWWGWQQRPPVSQRQALSPQGDLLDEATGSEMLWTGRATQRPAGPSPQ